MIADSIPWELAARRSIASLLTVAFGAVIGCGGSVSPPSGLVLDAGPPPEAGDTIVQRPDAEAPQLDDAQVGAPDAPSGACSGTISADWTPPPCSRDGCTSVPILTDLPSTTAAIAVDDNDIYLADSASGVIIRRSLADLAAVTTVATGFQGVVAMTLDCQSLYVSAVPGGCVGVSPGRVVAISRVDGSLNTLMDAAPSCPSGLAVSAGVLYVPDLLGQVLTEVPLGASSAPTTLSIFADTWGVAKSGCSLYLSITDGADSLWLFDTCVAAGSLSGARLWSSVANNGIELHPNSVIVGGQYALWANRGSTANGGADGGIMMVPAQGGQAYTVVPAPNARSLVANDAGLFWVEQTVVGGPARVAGIPR